MPHGEGGFRGGHYWFKTGKAPLSRSYLVPAQGTCERLRRGSECGRWLHSANDDGLDHITDKFHVKLTYTSYDGNFEGYHIHIASCLYEFRSQ